MVPKPQAAPRPAAPHSQYVNYDFTSGVEEQLDAVSGVEAGPRCLPAVRARPAHQLDGSCSRALSGVLSLPSACTPGTSPGSARGALVTDRLPLGRLQTARQSGSRCLSPSGSPSTQPLRQCQVRASDARAWTCLGGGGVARLSLQQLTGHYLQHASLP